MTAANALIAAPVDTSTPFQGAFLLEDGESLVAAIKSGDWVAGGLAAFSAIADTVAAVMDPIGSLIGAGLGWVMEHLEPLKGWLNDLTGDAGEVAAFAQTWTNISKQLSASGDELARILSDLGDADGEAVQAYLRFQADTAKHLTAAGTWADGLSTGLQIASSLVQIVHDLVRDAIAQVVGAVISYAAELVLSVGLATPYVAAQASSRVASLSSRVGSTITKLLKSSEELMKLVDRLSTLFRKFDGIAKRVLPGGGHGGADVPKHVGGPETPRHGEGPDAPTHGAPDGGDRHLVDTSGRDLGDIRAQSTLTDDQLEQYLRAQKGGAADADAFAADGTWPSDVQIPKDPSVLRPDGSIDWDQVPNNGYVLDDAGNPIKEAIVPEPGDRIDRFGPSDGRFTSPIPEDGKYPYPQRSLPYVEDPAHYHQYEVTRPFDELRAAYDECPDPSVKKDIDDLVEKGYFSWDSGSVQSGGIAGGFGESGGGVQWQMPLSVDLLEKLGMLHEVGKR